MLIPVLIISSLVHIYSISYMSSDPHNQRFFSYLSLFTFMMIILVTANNYLLMFVGWEGSLIKCLKWWFIMWGPVISIYILYIKHTINMLYSSSNTSISQTKPRSSVRDNRGWPYGSEIKQNRSLNKQKKDLCDSNIISLIIGSLLNNSYLEKRELGLSVRIIFIKSNSNVEYLSWFHKYLASNGYCSQNKPRLHKSIGNGNKVLYSYCLKTYSFTSFVWLYDLFYKNNVKIIPRNLYKYLTPLALATWFLSGLHIEPSKKFEVYMKSSITIKDLRYLAWILKKKYNIYSVIVLKKNTSSTHTVNECYNNNNNLIGFLQIKESSRPIFSNIVRPHILPSLHYRLSERNLRLGVPLVSKAKYSTFSV